MRTIFLILIIFFIFAQKHAYTEPKIIKKISEIENFTFDFEQLINDKKETGNCIISFNNKMILNKIIPIENELDFSISIFFRKLIFYNYYNSGDI